MKFFDVMGEENNMPFSKKQVLGLIISVAVFLLCLVIPINGVDSEKANLILATVMFIIVSQVTGFLSIVQVIFPMLLVWVITGCTTLGLIVTNAGTASFLMILGFFIVAMGANKTNFAKRLAYFLLEKLGRSPSLIILALCIATALLSSFLGNFAVAIMMSAVGSEILTELDEKPGTSNFGRCLMLCIGVCTCLGGMMLMNGSPSTNVFGVAAIQSATGIEITYRQWAIIAFPIGLCTIFPVWFIYTKWFKVSKSMQGKSLDGSYFKNKRKELGPMSGAEIRWLIYVLGMIICMMLNSSLTTVIALFFGALCILPVIGVVSKDECLKNVSWEILCGSLAFPIMGALINESGLGAWLMGSLLGWAGDFNIIVLVIISVFVVWILNSVLVNSQTAIITVSTVALCGMATELGINPIVLVMPTVLVYDMRHVLGMQMDLYCVHGYGYWEQKDTVIPGVLSSIAWMALIIIGCFILIPLAGVI